jgi:hypothetical protein
VAGKKLEHLYDFVRFGWVRQEEEAELIILQEFKRLVAKRSFSETDLRKLKNLRNILDEYENRRSILARDIESIINRHRGSAADKTAVLNEMIVTLNKHTGSTMRIARDLSGKQPKNDFREIKYAE